MRKIGKNIISLLLATMIIFGSVAVGVTEMDFAGIFFLMSEATTYSGICGDNLTWDLDTYTGLLTINGTGKMTDWVSISGAPWYIQRKMVKKVTIASDVTSVGSYVFYDCTNLTSVTFAKNSQLSSINESAFNGCDSLISIEIPSSVTSIGVNAFGACDSLTSIEIPSSVTSIGVNAFGACDSLTSINVDVANEYYSNNEFGILFNKNKTELVQCPAGLTSAEIPSSVTSIGERAFIHCVGLTNIEIPSSVTSIGSHAFYHCTSLTSVTFGENSQLTSVGENAFSYCKSLTNIEIPSDVTAIGKYAFDNCIGLTSITFGENSQLTSIGKNAFSYCIGLKSIEIPSSVTSIGGAAFYDCDSLTSVSFGENSQLISIGEGAFYDCDSLTSIEVPSSVTSIGGAAFHSSDNLTSVEIFSGITSIGERAFCNCTSLEYVHIPISVTTIERNILYYTTAYICSTTEDCYAKTYADENNIDFKLCNGHIKEDVLTEIKVASNPVKTTYFVGDTLDTTGLVLAVTYNNGKSETISEGFTCNPSTLETAGKQKITIIYGDKSTSFNVEVKEVEIFDISIASVPETLSYYVGDTLSIEGLSILVTYNNGTTKTVTNGFTCSPSTLNTEGTQKITVTYGGKTATFNVSVATVKVTELEIVTAPHKTSYKVGDMFDPTGLTMNAVNSKGEEIVVTEGFVCTPEILEKSGTQVVTVSYGGKSIMITVVVEEEKAETYVVKFISNGVVISEEEYEAGEAIVKPADPALVGYKFMGWTPDVPSVMPEEALTFTAKFEKSYICPDCGDEILGEAEINAHIAAEARMKATVKIKNNPGSRTIKYGEILRLTAITTNMPADAKVYWYVDGVKKGEGTTFEVSPTSGSVQVAVKLVDSRGNVLENANGDEISDSQKVAVNAGFFQKLISFFKNLFGMNRTLVQVVKTTF